MPEMPSPLEFPITEVPGQCVTDEQLSMLYTRYRFASTYCHGKEILEVALGGGQGLRYLARVAKRAVGTDIDRLVIMLSAYYCRDNPNIAIQLADAHLLPYKKNIFDVVILFDSIYWLHKPGQFIREAHRTLKDNGTLLISSVNPEWSDFNPSPYATTYLSPDELWSLLASEGFETELFTAFFTSSDAKIEVLTSIIRRLASRLNLIPTSIRGKEMLKRIFYGRLKAIPLDITDSMAPYYEPVPLSHFHYPRQFKIFYAVARKI
jgi:SAM-dependent methyltransferase